MRRLAAAAVIALMACGSGGSGSAVDAGGSDATSAGGGSSPRTDASVETDAGRTDAGRTDAADAGDAEGGSGALVDAGPGSGKVFLAFIGDSITAGVGASTEANDWVSLLASRLGASAVVGNFGVSGTTMMKTSDAPYWASNGLSRAAAFLASAGASDVAAVVVMLGTNDAKDDPDGVDNWTATAPTRFHDDYASMIALLQAARAPAPGVFLALPPRAYAESYGIDPAVLAQQIVPIVRGLASADGLPLVDIFGATGDAGGDFPSDGIHPDDDGQRLIAGAMYTAITPVIAPDGGWPDGG